MPSIANTGNIAGSDRSTSVDGFIQRKLLLLGEIRFFFCFAIFDRFCCAERVANDRNQAESDWFTHVDGFARRKLLLHREVYFPSSTDRRWMLPRRALGMTLPQFSGDLMSPHTSAVFHVEKIITAPGAILPCCGPGPQSAWVSRIRSVARSVAIEYAILKCLIAVETNAPSVVRKNIPCPLICLRLVQWCHGAPGIIPMLTKAHEVFEDER